MGPFIGEWGWCVHMWVPRCTQLHPLEGYSTTASSRGLRLYKSSWLPCTQYPRLLGQVTGYSECKKVIPWHSPLDSASHPQPECLLKKSDYIRHIHDKTIRKNITTYKSFDEYIQDIILAVAINNCGKSAGTFWYEYKVQVALDMPYGHLRNV